MMFTDVAPGDDCRNPDSMGEVCCYCNACGRDKNRRIPTLDEMEAMALSANCADDVDGLNYAAAERNGQMRLMQEEPNK